jgi:glycosyltransferase involved in cell wall biosynthesis
MAASNTNPASPQEDKSRVTWIMPVLNAMPYLEECMNSIYAETGAASELFVWDNGSTDGSLELLRQWIPGRIPGRIFLGDHNTVGFSLARLAEQAETEFLLRMDADDVRVAGTLDQQLEYMRNHPTCAAVGGQLRCIDQAGNPTYRICPKQPLQHDEIVAALLDLTAPIGHNVVLLRRKAVLEVGNYRDVPNVEDRDLWIRLATRYHLANLPLHMALYRIHDRSTTRIAIKKKKLKPYVVEISTESGPPLFGWSRAILAKFWRCRLYRLDQHISSLRIPTLEGPAPDQNPAVLEVVLMHVPLLDVGATVRILRHARRMGLARAIFTHLRNCAMRDPWIGSVIRWLWNSGFRWHPSGEKRDHPPAGRAAR